MNHFTLFLYIVFLLFGNNILSQSFTEDQKLVAIDANGLDFFGQSVSVNGDIAIIGAFGNDDNGSGSGCAYIFSKGAGGLNQWGEIRKLIGSDVDSGDQFGYSASVDNNLAIVGAPRKTTGGSAYIFSKDAGGLDQWGEIAKLNGGDSAAGDQFGRSVSVDGDLAVVGAWSVDVGMNSSVGAAYIFSKNVGGPNQWGELIKLTASDAEAGDLFGVSVSVSGDIIVVGAHKEDGSGSVYIFSKDEGGLNEWGEIAKLKSSDIAAGDEFGARVFISGDILIVSADLNDDHGSISSSGSAYIFEKDIGGLNQWGELTKLTASDADGGDRFGHSVSINGDIAVVGSWFDDDAGSRSGSAYLFSKDQGGLNQWGQIAKLTAGDAAADDLFGNAVAVNGNIVIVGARGNQDAGDNTGSAYIFELPDCPSSYSAIDNNMLTGIQSLNDVYDTDGIIESTQQITNGAIVEYDSGISIDLLPTFEVDLGVMFHAFIDGCGSF